MNRRSNPFDFGEFESLFERMSRQFDDMNRQLGGWDGGMMHMRGMSIDLAEYDDEIVVVADLPGYEKEDIDLKVSGQTLTVVADRETSSEEGDEGEYIRRERRSTSVRRSIRLPVEVDEENASAEYKNGVLTVTLPKITVDESDDAHDIDVN